uniref:Uncharacterized protein n=1 Tax=Arundo donax TaxID=35708 RepID=A0A0A9G5Z0_ARUDO
MENGTTMQGFDKMTLYMCCVRQWSSIWHLARQCKIVSRRFGILFSLNSVATLSSITASK